LEWLQRAGVQVADLTASTVAGLLSNGVPAIVKRVLDMRQQLARTSLAKFEAVERAACVDGRARGLYIFHGASTGRFTGRLFQPHNLPRPTLQAAEIAQARELVADTDATTWAMLYDDPMGALVSLIRSVIAPQQPGKLTVADLASIESVMAAWVAESDYLVGLFRAGRDPYKDFASKLYGVKYEEVTKAQRSFCKPCVLGAQYGLSAAGLQKYAENFGLEMDEKAAKTQLSIWRKAYGEIPGTWNRIQDACLEAIQQPGTVLTAGRCAMLRDKEYLMIKLPSGRKLFYRGAQKTQGRYGTEIQYQDSVKGPIRTFGARLFENIVQAVARDVLAAGLANAHNAGLCIIGHVHDEIIVEGDCLSVLIEAMTTPPPWCADAPIRAEGYVADYYRKD
jgi:DNA polymerase